MATVLFMKRSSQLLENSLKPSVARTKVTAQMERLFPKYAPLSHRIMGVFCVFLPGYLLGTLIGKQLNLLQ